MLALNTASDWDSFRAAAAQFAVPAQNLVYADREGHIGYQAPGMIPIRKSGNDGYLPAEGWRADDDWTGDYVPFEGLPSVLDPEEGFVVTANQAVTDPDYPYHLTDEDDWDHGYRSQRIRRRSRTRASSRSPRWPTCSSTTAAPIAPDAGAVPARVEVAAQLLLAPARNSCARWDFSQAADSSAAAYFNVVWRNVLRADLPRRPRARTSGRTAASGGWP